MPMDKLVILPLIRVGMGSGSGGVAYIAACVAGIIVGVGQGFAMGEGLGSFLAAGARVEILCRGGAGGRSGQILVGADLLVEGAGVGI